MKSFIPWKVNGWPFALLWFSLIWFLWMCRDFNAYVSSRSRLNVRSNTRLAMSSSSWMTIEKIKFERKASNDMNGFGKVGFVLLFEWDLLVLRELE